MPGSTVSLYTVTVLVLLTWQQVSNFMPGPAMPRFIVLTFTFVVLGWQYVCKWICATSPTVSLLTVLIPTLVLLALTGSEWFNHLSSVLSHYPHFYWFCWLDGRKWVNPDQVQLCPFSLSSLSLWFYGLTGSEWFHARSSYLFFKYYSHFHSGPVTWQEVSESMPGLAMSILTVLISPLVLLALQFVSDFMLDLAGPFSLSSFLALLFCWLDSKWVILCQVQLSLPFSLSSFPFWTHWLDRRWVILYQVQFCLFSPLIFALCS